MQPVNLQAGFGDPLSTQQKITTLQHFENQLNPCRPEEGPMGAGVIACGEVSSVLTLAGLPGQVCKRMAGFETMTQVRLYMDLVRQYSTTLESIGISVVPTELFPVRSPLGGFVVYLLQPVLDRAELGNEILKTGSDDDLFYVVSGFLSSAEKAFAFNERNSDSLSIAADSQISNWHVTGNGIHLLDVGTPFLRLHGKDLFDSSLIGKAMPLPIRFVFNRAGLMQRYSDSYFSPREIIIDHVANYIKEGRPDRMPTVLEYIHRWIAENGRYLTLTRAITLKEVRAFYRKDVLLLEAFMQCRRLDRFIKTRVIGKPYHYILPEGISRF